MGIKRFTIVALFSVLLFVAPVSQLDVHASIAEEGVVQTEKRDSLVQFINNCDIVWKNGQLVIEQKEEPNSNITLQPEREQVEEGEKAPEENIIETPNKDDNNTALNEFELAVFELTNEERVKQGLAPLHIDEQLSQVAREKSQDMAVNGYFDHQSPTYGSPFDMMRSFGVTYQTAGENIAKGQRTPEEVVNAWMNSPGHRANILSNDFTHIGIGYVEQGHLWTQQFIGK